jgi:predicted nuclease of restriction endonuclease-like (RecB) superfamily
MMDKKEVVTIPGKNHETHLDKNYIVLLNEIKSRLKVSQLKATISVNKELLKFYWEVGTLIIEQQEKKKWGDKLFERLSRDLTAGFPGTKGFSITNLKSMRNFASHYPNGEFSQALPDQLSWTQHITLMQMIDSADLHKKQWYAGKVIEEGWGYRELRGQIKSGLYERQADKNIKTTNFYEKLPSPTSQLAQEMIKEPYKFHFLTVGEDAYEKEIHRGLVNHIKQFLMELGQGFALYGTNYPIHVSGKRFEIDLLMYNTKLHSYVVVELKRGDFQPQHAGQLNFYLSAVDAQIKMPEDGPTIGLILCEKKDKVIAEYALKRVGSPMGISEYELSKSLPSRLYNVLPTTEEIEAELNEFTEKMRMFNKVCQGLKL